MVKKILLIFLAWRVFLFIPLLISQRFLEFRKGFDYTSPNYFIDELNPISHFLLSPFGNFDGVYYLSIAAKGYTVDNAGFFPLFPLLINITSSIFGAVQAFDLKQYFIALILVSIFFPLSLIMMYKLIRIDYKNNAAISAIVFMLLFPTSFFFAGIYSESLFLLLTILSFYFARKKKWLLASVFGSLLTATRIVGIAIIPALIFEFWKTEGSLFKKRVFSLFLIPLGLFSYMIFNYANWGNALQFAQAQGNLANERSVGQIILFPQTIFRYFKILTSVSPSIYEWWVALLEISAFVFAAVLLYIAWKKKVRTSYLIFSIAAFLIPASSGTFTGLPRYVLVLFPIFIALALIKNKQSLFHKQSLRSDELKQVKIIYSIVCLILLFILFMLFSKGYYVS